MFAMLANFFQSNDIHFTAATDDFNTQAENQYGDILNLAPRTYNHFSDAANENAQSRVYIGVHFDFDKQQGVDEGYRIADYVFNNELQPLHGGQTGIAVNILNTVLAPQMANDFANELAAVGFNPSASRAGGKGGGLAEALATLRVGSNSVTTVGWNASSSSGLQTDGLGATAATSQLGLPSVAASTDPTATAATSTPDATSNGQTTAAALTPTEAIDLSFSLPGLFT